MTLFRKLLSTFLLTLLIGVPWANAQVLLTENELIKRAKKTTPRSQQIQAQKQGAAAENFATRSQYDPKVDASYSYASSREDAIIQFAPVFQPQKLMNIGVSKNTSLGAKVSTNLFSQQISAPRVGINNATQVGVQLGLEIDIWKNIMGRLDRSQLQSASLNKQISDLKAEIDQHGFVLDMRKVFWSLIANEVSLNLSKQLVKTAEQQLNESKRKLREGLGDSGDVARNQAQLQSRESSVLVFSYQKEILISQLRSMIPELQSLPFTINRLEARDMEGRAQQCMAQIASQKKLNTNFSRYSEITALLDSKKEHDLRVARATDSFDVKLQAQYQASGVNGSYSDAYDRLTDEFKNGYQVGVALKIPLGGDITRSREARVSATQSQILSQKESLSLQLKAEHEKIQRAMTLLIKASESQTATIKNLEKSLNRTKRKYKQARVSLNTFILEQDNLFSSQLQLIDTKRQILHLLLDYFKVFSKHPCEINGAQA